MIPEPRDQSPSVPSGTVTFVFTDIEGSTQRWDRDRFAMETAVRRHDAIMRASIAAHRGYVFKTIGDAFCAAFSRPEDAVAAMIDAQRSLATEDFSAVGGLRVRVAIHTGTADERDRDYFGPAVNRVARLLGIAYGGQTIVSGVTGDLVQGSLPSQASLRDLGEHRLRDLSRPEYVYQVVAPGLAVDFPPLRSLGALSNNLPAHLTSFVGREAELAEITELIEKNRLVTIVGSGGIGKTRTSLQVAANSLDGSGDGVWFVELAPLASGDYIPSTIAQALGVTLGSHGDPIENIVAALKAKRVLLVFDNCEHLIEAAAKAIAALLRGCPNVTVLASSRQGLGIAGEVTYRMPSLSVPHSLEGTVPTVATASSFAAVALFVERARAADTRFELTDDNAPIVADICRRLDGIALAIELAASRVKMLSPKQVRSRLDERFRVLTGGSRDVLPRQQTLRALIDWSHDLLDARERTLFRRIAIFVSGFTLEGSVAIGRDEDLDEFEVFDVLASLVEKSLVLAEPDGDALRYRLLESTRAYAAEKLAEAGEREALATRHLLYLRDRFCALKAELDRTAASLEFLRAFETELEDVRAALEWALAGPDLLAGAELIAALERLWEMTGLAREGIARIESFLSELPEDRPLLRANLLGTSAALFISLGDARNAADAATRGVAYARAAGDRAVLAFALHCQARAQAFVGDVAEARAALTEADAISESPARLRLFLLDMWAMLYGTIGDFDAAARVRVELREEWRRRGNEHNEHVQTFHLSLMEQSSGRTESAITVIRELIPKLRRTRNPALLAEALLLLASHLMALDSVSEAIDAAREAIDLFRSREPDYFLVTIAIQDLGLAFALQGDARRAALLQGYAQIALERSGTKRDAIGLAMVGRLNALLEERLTQDTLASLLAEGASLAPEDAVALAIDPAGTMYPD